MNNRMLTALALCSLLFAVVSLAAPATAQDTGSSDSVVHEVTVDDENMLFTPKELTINIGDTVYFHWLNTSQTHNVAESSSADSNEYDQQGFRSGDPSTTVDFNVTFPMAGTYFFICEPHSLLGMKGSITVIDPNASSVENEVSESTPGFTFLPVLASVGAALLVSRSTRRQHDRV